MEPNSDEFIRNYKEGIWLRVSGGDPSDDSCKLSDKKGILFR